MRKGNALLSIEGLTVAFDGAPQPSVDDVSLTIEEGRILGVVGESGCGKTSLARAVIGELPARGVIRRGSIHFAGRDLLSVSRKELKALQGVELGMITQEALSSLNPVRKIGSQFVQTLCEKMLVSRQEAERSAREFLEKMSCPEDILSRYPFQLSGGQRQRVLVAMAFALYPRLLLADEPTTALDSAVQMRVLKEMMALKTNCGASIMLISHNLGVIAQVCDEVAVMYRGRIVEYGEAKAVMTSPSHPYTRGLIGSIAYMDCDRNRKLYTIPECRDTIQRPGCIFYSRCEWCAEKCAHEPPPLRINDRGVLVACSR
ncbi:MAG: ABC transporter ATP-binding protein [Synergistaceae bacterium]|jgi:oligopeptide/dipeptide ABC transporter ATP-binding protein|nr:ABC transporter ATP-binding protein [Synergistaceae bacterium]